MGRFLTQKTKKYLTFQMLKISYNLCEIAFRQDLTRETCHALLIHKQCLLYLVPNRPTWCSQATYDFLCSDPWVCIVSSFNRMKVTPSRRIQCFLQVSRTICDKTVLVSLLSSNLQIVQDGQKQHRQPIRQHSRQPSAKSLGWSRPLRSKDNFSNDSSCEMF